MELTILIGWKLGLGFTVGAFSATVLIIAFIAALRMLFDE